MKRTLLLSLAAAAAAAAVAAARAEGRALLCCRQREKTLPLLSLSPVSKENLSEKRKSPPLSFPSFSSLLLLSRVAVGAVWWGLFSLSSLSLSLSSISVRRTEDLRLESPHPPSLVRSRASGQLKRSTHHTQHLHLTGFSPPASLGRKGDSRVCARAQFPSQKFEGRRKEEGRGWIVCLRCLSVLLSCLSLSFFLAFRGGSECV